MTYWARRFHQSAVLAGFLAVGSSALMAQGIITGSINGTVQDPSGAVIPAANVTVTHIATGVVTKATCDQAGVFNISNLPVGLYRIAIAGNGFQDRVLEHVEVDAGKETGLGAERLSAGGAVETVEVTSAENLLETTQSQVTTEFDAVEVANLPTFGGFDELVLLIPGVASTHGNNRSNTNGANFSVNGQRGRSNNFELDGQSNNDNSVGGPQVFFQNSDAISQLQVITNNFSAQYGRDAGSVVNYITKSGTNQIHGTAFEYYEGSWLSSLTQAQKGPQFGYCAPGQTTGCTPVHKPRFTDNTFGGSLGGPFIKDKLFGFGSALFARNFSGATQLNSGTIGSTSGYTPTPAGVQALVGAFPNNPAVQALQAYGPYAISLGTVAQIGQVVNVPVTDGTKTVTVPVSLYSRNITPYSTDEEVLGRLDYQATPKDRFYLRYFYQNEPTVPYNQTVTGASVFITDNTHSIGADWTRTLSNRIVNQLRYSFQQSKLIFAGGVFSNCTTASFNTCPTSVGVSTSSSYRIAASNGLSITPISSFGLSSSYPQGRVVKDTQIQDNLTLTYGKHAMTTGFAFEYQNSPNVFLPNISGAFTFFGANGLLQDNGQVGLAIGNPNIHFTEPDWAAYFQDDWKVTPALTVNLGMRWEFFSQSINLLHNLSAANQTGSAPLWNTSLPLSQTTFPQIPNDYKHFEPRIGFAYNPTTMPSLVVRGGYSMNIAPAFYNIFLNSYGSAPVVLSNTITGCNNTTKLCLPGSGATYASVHALDNQYLTTTAPNPGAFSQTVVAPNFRQPITQTYSLGIQQQVKRFAVVEVRYVGAHTSGDFQSINANPAVGAAAKAFPNYFGGASFCTDPKQLGYNGGNSRVNCAQTLVRSRQNTSFEVYNGLQTSVTSRSFHGLTANFAYTYSRTIDNASEIFGTNGVGTTVAFAQNPLNTDIGERGVSGNSYPNVTSLGLVYVDPFYKNIHNLAGRLLGGFQFNTIYLFNSGQPYTPYMAAAPSGSEANFCDYTFDSTFAGVSTCRPILSNAAAPLGTVGYNAGNGVYKDLYTGATVARSSEHWLVNNTAEAIALGNPYPGVGRNTLRGGSFNNMDASLYKNNQVSERLNVQLQCTISNLLNRAFYGGPDAAIEDAGSTFANYTGNTGSNRNVQIGARLIF